MPVFVRLHHRLLASLALLIFVPVATVAAASIVLSMKPARFTRDLSSLAGVHPLLGFLSSLGVLLWCASAALWLFASHLSSRRTPADREASFARHMGVLSVYLCLDDLFQIHENLAPKYLGIPDYAVYGMLGVATLSIVWRARRVVLCRDAVLLLAALAVLGASAALDAVLGRWLWPLGQWAYLVEDGLKWAGICLWIAFAVGRCSKVLSPTLLAASPQPETG